MNANDDDVMSVSCDLFKKRKFKGCCELLQRTVDKFHLDQITTQKEVEFILLRNNLLVCNCLVCVIRITFLILLLSLNL